MDSTRVDRWLWGVRIYKTRTLATDACRGGHVKVNGTTAKPATIVAVGDRVETFVHDRHRVLEVAGIVDKRVSPAAAAVCVVDHSPPPPPREERLAPLFSRDPGAGRPTKRDRRALDRLRSQP